MSPEAVQQLPDSATEARPRPTDAEWKRHRATLTDLYIRKHMPLTGIQKIMERKYRFYATERMFKSRIKAWGLSKNLRPEEVLAMARVQTRRDAQGKSATFWRYGHMLEQSVPKDAIMRGRIEALLPPHIVVLEPMRPLRGDEQLYSAETISVALSAYLEECPLAHDRPAMLSNAYIWTYLEMRASQQKGGGPSTAILSQCLLTAFEAFGADIRSSSPQFIPIALHTFQFLRRDLLELAQTWVEYGLQLCRITHGPLHPWSRLFAGLSQLLEGVPSEADTLTLLATAFRDHTLTQATLDGDLLVFSHFVAYHVSVGSETDVSLELQKCRGLFESASSRFGDRVGRLARFYASTLMVSVGDSNGDYGGLVEDSSFTKSERIYALLATARTAGSPSECKALVEDGLRFYRCHADELLGTIPWQIIGRLQHVESAFADRLDGLLEPDAEISGLLAFLNMEKSRVEADLLALSAELTLDDK